ncbi:hypothetical protein BV898_14239 [Hypsibius exemplaris]|uniref:Uncharacterized protein n=1 Tax=Hypsibius exemplaris TaxID=2072580 RepID=A0A1W0W8C5_HYPEX|nr:hypothetical protein BV898_14239 [Hypsibius exemplaris]
MDHHHHPPQHHSEESQDAAVEKLFSMLCSPSLSRFAAEQRNYVPTEMPQLDGPSTSAPAVSHYQTRSRAAAPFSPPRTAVHRQGHTYHIVDPEYVVAGRGGEGMEQDDAPVIHIPDGTNRSGEASSTFSVADIDYAHFIEELQGTPSSELSTNNRRDNRQEDPDFYLRKKDDEESADDYCKRVPQREIQLLHRDLQRNPIPGLLPLLDVEPPGGAVPITRSRCKSIELPSCSPAASPMKSPLSSPFPQTRSMVRGASVTSPVEHPVSEPIVPRTRLQVSQSPQKMATTTAFSLKPSSAEAFKKPHPVGEPHGKRQKIGPPPAQQQYLPKFPGTEPNHALPEPPVSALAKIPPELRERFKAVGVKYSKLSNNSTFSTEEKEFVQLMLAKAINRHSSVDAIALVEYVMRMVELVSGERSVAQVLPYFEAAKQKDFPFVALVFGVLIADDSPIILDLLPSLYGKTKLFKSMRTEMQLAAAGLPEEQEQLLKSFKAAMKINDRSYGVPHDTSSPMAVRLGVTGKEGLIDASILKFIEEENIYGVDEHSSDRYHNRRSISSDAVALPIPPAVAVAPVGRPEATKPTASRQLSWALTHIPEAQSDGSNSSMHGFTLGHDATVSFSAGGGNSGLALYSAVTAGDLIAGSSGMECTATVETAKEPPKPRRVQLITTALTGSPLKNPQFVDPTDPTLSQEGRRNTLRSAMKLPSTY